MGYKDQAFGDRLATLGDPAEQAFIQMMGDDTFETFGWRRPSTGMGKMSPTLRHAPDFYTGKGFLVEVMGCGRDLILKGLKVQKWQALNEWNDVQQVAFWIWNSHLARGMWVTFEEMKQFVQLAPVKKFENDGNRYYEIPWVWLGGEAT